MTFLDSIFRFVKKQKKKKRKKAKIFEFSLHPSQATTAKNYIYFEAVQ